MQSKIKELLQSNHCISLNLAHVPNIKIFIKRGNFGEIHRLFSLYQEKVISQNNYIINIYPSELFMEWQEDNFVCGIVDFGCVTYNKEELEEILEEIITSNTPYEKIERKFGRPYQ